MKEKWNCLIESEVFKGKSIQMSRAPDNQAVDEFGRSIVNRRVGGGEQGGNQQEFFRQQGDRHNSRERGRHNGFGGRGRRSRSRERRQPSPPYHGHGRDSHFEGGRGQHGRNNNGRNAGSDSHHPQQSDVYANAIKSITFKGITVGGDRRGDRRGGSSGNDDRQFSFHMNPLNLSTIHAIKSYKNFVANLKAEFQPEEYQQLYTKYYRDYAQSFSDAFFNTVVSEEWFQDRYNPVNIHRIEKESATWASEESARFRDSFYQHPVEFLAACSLDPSAKYNHHKTHGVQREESNNSSDGANGIEGDVASMEESTAVVPESSSSGVVVAGKHLSGHENRTVYISEIHACCPKSVFKEAIITALTTRAAATTSASSGTTATSGDDEANAVAAPVAPQPALNMQPERILIAQPIWSTKNIEKFERSAWIVMPTVEAAKKAVEILKNFEITVQKNVRDPFLTKNALALQFKIQSSLHSSRLLNSLPDFMSSSYRIKADIERAMKLAALLDEDRDVPEANRLHSILMNASERIVNMIELPTQHLDLCIAYLRRVHFLSFYAGKRFREESHLLAMSSSVVFRNKAYTTAPGEENVKYNIRSALGVDSESSAVAAMNTEEQSGHEEEENVETSAADNDGSGAVVATEEGEDVMQTDGNDAATSALVPAPPSASKVGIRVPTIASDKKLAPLIAELTARVQQKRRRKQEMEENSSSSGAVSTVGLSINEIEAMEIEEAMQNRLESFVTAHCREADDKCRCCFDACNKLFKASTFIIKHLKMKHDAFTFSEVVIDDAISYMSKRFRAEALEQQPLPPVAMEVSNGIEMKSVRELLAKTSIMTPMVPMLTTPLYPIVSYGPAVGGNNNRSFNPRGGRGDGFDGDKRPYKRGRMDADSNNRNDFNRSDRRPSFSNDHNDSQSAPPAPPTSATSSFHETTSFGGDHKITPRKMVKYVDVDAPKEQLVTIDHTLLPPPKKRKFGGSGGATAAGASPN